MPTRGFWAQSTDWGACSAELNHDVSSNLAMVLGREVEQDVDQLHLHQQLQHWDILVDSLYDLPASASDEFAQDFKH